MMTDAEFKELVEDIKGNGLIMPIETYQGKIIDGRNRYKACIEAGVEPMFNEWNGKGSLVNHVVSLNMHRRHLTSSQKAVVAIDILPMLEKEAKERQRKAGQEYGRGQEKVQQIIARPIETQRAALQARDIASQLTGTNRQYVSDAKKIAQQAPEVLEKVREGVLTIPDARKVASLPNESRLEPSA